MTQRNAHGPPVPSVPDYAFHWFGPALVLETVSWRKTWVSEIQIDELQKKGLIDALRELKPPALIIDVTEVPMFSAMCGAVLVMLAREMDAIRNPGRISIVGAMPSVLDYLRITQLAKLFDLQPTENAAVERIEKWLAAARFAGGVPWKTQYFSFENNEGTCLVTVAAGLFDRMPEVQHESAGPTYEELRSDFYEGWPSASPAVLLDVRSAGEFNHRTMSVMAHLSRMVKETGGRIVVCIPGDTVPIWQVCKFDKLVAPYFTEPAAALKSLTEGDRNSISLPGSSTKGDSP